MTFLQRSTTDLLQAVCVPASSIQASVSPPITRLQFAKRLASALTLSILMGLMGCQPNAATPNEAPSDTHSDTHSEDPADPMLADHDHNDEHADEHEHDGEHADEHGEHADEHDEHADEHDEHADEHGEHADEHGEHEHDEHADEHDSHAGHDHGVNRIHFACVPSQDIGVFYHRDSTPATAHLLIEGIEYDLNQLPTTRNATEEFGSALGLTEAQGLLWQVHGQEATLSSVPSATMQAMSTPEASANTDNMGEQQVLYTCQQQD